MHLIEIGNKKILLLSEKFTIASFKKRKKKPEPFVLKLRLPASKDRAEVLVTPIAVYSCRGEDYLHAAIEGNGEL